MFVYSLKLSLRIDRLCAHVQGDPKNPTRPVRYNLYLYTLYPRVCVCISIYGTANSLCRKRAVYLNAQSVAEP